MDPNKVFRERRGQLPIVAPVAYAAGEAGLMIYQYLFNIGCVKPSHPHIAHEVGVWIRDLLDGKPCTIRIIVCPDYSYDYDPSNVNKPFTYTFKALGEGIGIVANRALKRIPGLWQLLQQFGVTREQLTFIVHIADNEGESDDLRARLGVDRAEFHARAMCSLAALEAALLAEDPTIPLRCEPLQASNPERWERLSHSAAEILAAGKHFGPLRMIGEPDWYQRQWDSILRARTNLYSRLYPGVPPAEALARQCVDYIAAGQLMHEEPGGLYLGVDNHAMGLFMQGGDRTCAVMYVMANYD